MSAKISLDTALRPFVIVTNVGVNALTRLYDSFVKNKLSAATFHYNVKVTVYNTATALLAYKVGKATAGKSSLRSIIIDVSLLLFIRAVIEKSMSIKGGVESIATGIANIMMKDSESLEELSITDTAFTTLCLTTVKTKLINGRKENMFVIRGFPVLKSWA